MSHTAKNRDVKQESLPHTAGKIVGFNRNRDDLIEIAKILGLSIAAGMNIGNRHDDMMRIIPAIR
jgi:hypothetical protein